MSKAFLYGALFLINLYFCIKLNLYLKRFVAHSFVLLYLLAMARPVIPLAEYIIYEDYISEFLCVNKNNTALECNGKCYLMQRLSEQSEEKRQNLPKIALEEYPIGFVEIVSCNGCTMEFFSPLDHIGYYNLYTYLFSPNNFHPPTILI